MGNLDILVCGNSDPGTSGLLSPFGKINGLYFDDSEEKDDFMYEFQKDLAEIEKKNGIRYIKMDFDSSNDFYDMMMKLQKFEDEQIKIYATSRAGHYEVVIEPEDGDDSDDKPSLSTTVTKRSRKKKAETTQEESVNDTTES